MRIRWFVVVLLGLLILGIAPVLGQDAAAEPVIYTDVEFPELPFVSRWVEVNSSKMHYLEAGDPAGDTILLLHGQPTWSYLWRDVIPHLEDHGRVIAVDLIGMGRSDKPDIDYRFVDHREYLAGFIDALALENILLVIHDWGSALGFDYAANHESNVRGIAFMEALVVAVNSFEEIQPVEFAEALQVFRTPGVGEELLINQNLFIEEFLQGAILRELSEAELDAYRAPYPTPSERIPVWRWPNEVPVGNDPADVAKIMGDYLVWLAETELPLLHLYATPGMINPEETVVAHTRSTFKNIETVNVGPGLHFIQEDQPDAIGTSIADWLVEVVNAE